jgi:iron complex outermembrane recepter protein
MSAGLTGNLVVPNPDQGGSYVTWYNPFSTQNYTCVNRVCTAAVGGGQVQTNPLASNPTSVLDQIFIAEKDTETTTYNIVDIVATGDLIDLPGGTVGAAFGGQWRGIQYRNDHGPIFNARDSWIGVGAPDPNLRRSVFATFAEVNVPVFDTVGAGMMEINAAVRQEWVKDDAISDLDSTNYKVSTRWSPRDWLALRASWSTAFNTPTLTELFLPRTVGLSNATDPFRGVGAFFGRSLGGTPDLKPQTADVYNVGFTLDLLDGDLSYSFDWKFFDFEDRIVRLIPADVLTEEFARYVAAGLPRDGNGVPTVTGLQQWLASGQANPGIVRDPGSLELVVVETPLINASSITWKGFDTRVSYRFEGADLPLVNRDIGLFRAGIEATYVQSYAYVRGPGAPEIEGAGRRNNATAFVPPTPRWRANMRVGWDIGIHSVVVIGRYTHGILNDGEAFRPFTATAAGRAILQTMQATNPDRTRFPSHTEWDLQYSLNLDGLFGDRRTNVQLGLLNAFDKQAPAILTLGGIETFLYDPRRRVWYVRASQEI